MQQLPQLLLLAAAGRAAAVAAAVRVLYADPAAVYARVLCAAVCRAVPRWLFC